MTISEHPQLDHYWLTPKGWTYAGYLTTWTTTCIGVHGRDCPVTIKADKPGGRCEFCMRTLALREAVPAA